MYFKQIDTFRFIAAITVVIAHWLQVYPIIAGIPWGRMGVDFFFVISGFLITLQLLHFKRLAEEKKITRGRVLWVFYIRRSLRIFPLYYFIVLGCTFYFRGELLQAIWWNVTYCSNFYFIQKQDWGWMFAHLWSLSIEEHFYLVWPFIILLFRRKWLPIVFVSVIAFSLAFKIGIYLNKPSDFALVIHTFSCMDLLTFGACLAYFYSFRQETFLKLFTSNITRVIVFTSLVGICCLFWINDGGRLWERLILRVICGVCFTFIVGIIVTGFKGFVGTIAENKVLTYLGKLSYGIYLLHNFIPEAIPTFHHLHLHPLIEFIIYALITIMCADILHRWIEKPFRRFYPTLTPSLKMG